MGISDSKIAFKQNVFKLVGDTILQPDDELWTEFWSIPECVDDVFNIWVPGDIRILTSTSPTDPADKPDPGEQTTPMKNLETLVYNAVAHMQKLQTTLLYPGDPLRSNREIVNCIRILTRLLPFIYEAEHLNSWYDRFFWKPRKPQYFWDAKKNKPSRIFDGLDPSREYGPQDYDKEIGPPLGETLIDLVLNFLFFRGFCLPSQEDEAGQPVLSHEAKVWQTGIGCSTSPRCTPENNRNQYETVRLLLTITSSTMYFRPDQIAMANIKPLTYLTTRLDKRVVNAINCSLLNTVLRFNPNLWTVPTGWHIGHRDNKKLLVMNCLQFLLVVMIYMPPLDAPNNGKNLFRASLATLFRPDDFQFIHTGVNLVISHPITASKYSIGKDDMIQWAPEMISFFWELVQCNKRFRRYLTETKVGMDYLIVLLWYAVDSKDDMSKQGIMRMAVFVLQTLSAEAPFADKLNIPFQHNESVPQSMRINNFHGTYADFLICSIHALFTTSKGRLESVYPALISIIKNIAPYQKYLQRATSSKILNIFEVLAAPGFLLQNEVNNALLQSLLDACNSILANHLNENPQFVKVLVGSKHRFKALRELTMEGALAELDRDALQRKDRGDAVNSVSHDSPQPSVSARPPVSAEVSEDAQFAIGDEDDEEDYADDADEADRDGNGVRGEKNEGDVVRRTQAEVAADSSPARLSEKARGKQPAPVNVSLATTSRSPSWTSLPTLTPTVSVSHPFRPSEPWLQSWFDRLPLDLILQTIEDAEAKQQHAASARTSTASRETDADSARLSTEKQPSERGGKARQSAQLSRQSFASDGGAQTLRADGQGHLGVAQDVKPAAGGPVNFQWTAVAVGWYNALIWSRIYLQEAEAFQGSTGLYNSTDIRLFRRHTASQEISLRSPKGAIDAVGNSLAQKISSGVSSMSLSK